MSKTGLKVYFWSWEQFFDQVQISSCTAKIKAHRSKMFGALTKILAAPKRDIGTLQPYYYYK